MQRTALYEVYADTGAKIVDFNGWALPVQFEGIIPEHEQTRNHAGLFDCSHMGEFWIRGREAIEAFDHLVFSEIHKLKQGRCRYSALLNDQAGIVDDCVALRIDDETLYLVTNAAPLDEVEAILSACGDGMDNVSAETTKIDLQGPDSRGIRLEIGLEDIAPMKYWSGIETTWNGKPIVVTRAGYTGELGYELFVPNEIGPDLWNALVNHPGVKPCGLGARDTLRTEVGYPLNGNDLAKDRTPLESGMERFIAWDKNFNGKAILEAQRDAGDYSVLVAIVSPDRRAPRHGFEVKRADTVVGEVTSGTFGPSLGHGVGLARVTQDASEPGCTLAAGPRDLEIAVTTIPVYKNGTCRMKFDT